MFKYTVMRKAKAGTDTGPNSHEDLWVVWDCEANDAQEAATTCADIPADYVVLQADPQFFSIDYVSELKVLQNDS